MIHKRSTALERLKFADTNLAKMYNHSCNLSPMILALSLVSGQTEQYKLILALNTLYLRSTLPLAEQITASCRIAF